MYKRCAFYASFLQSPVGKIVATSRMYKKLHNRENSSFCEPLPTKGSFLWCVPERVIMLTTFVYGIQIKKENPTAPEQ